MRRELRQKASAHLLLTQQPPSNTVVSTPTEPGVTSHSVETRSGGES